MDRHLHGPGRLWEPGWAASALARPEVPLTVLFIGSRLAAHQAGVAVERLPLNGAWQLLDPVLLETELLSSAWHLHSQPPLFNLLMGGLLKITPDAASAAAVLDASFAVLGWLLAILVYRLGRSAGAGATASLVAAVLFTLSPAAVLYENYPTYTLPSAVLLCTCALLFHRMIEAFSIGRALALFAAMAALVYLRALFQLPWLLVLCLLGAVLVPGRRWATALAAALPLLLVAGLYAKNAHLTGQLTTSTWFGMSLAKVTTAQLPPQTRQALVNDGVLSPLAEVPPFSAPDAYPATLAVTPATGVAALDAPHKTGGAVNFNHAVYPAVSRRYLADASTVVWRYPEVYVDTLATAYLMYFRPSADYPFLEPGRSRIEPWVRGYNAVIAGQPRFAEEPSFRFQGPGTIGYFIVAGFLVCLVFGAGVGWRLLRGSIPVSASVALLVFIWLNIVYVTVLGNAVEIDENQRFRFLINPLLAVMLAAAASRAHRFTGNRKDSHA